MILDVKANSNFIGDILPIQNNLWCNGNIGSQLPSDSGTSGDYLPGPGPYQENSTNSKYTSKNRNWVVENISPLLRGLLAIAVFVFSFLLQIIGWSQIVEVERRNFGIIILGLAYFLILFDLSLVIANGYFLSLFLEGL